MVDNDFIVERIIQLRTANNLSRSALSTALLRNKNYISLIERKRSFISLEGIFDICRYFKIEPKDFFDTENNDPAQINEFVTRLKHRSPRQIDRLIRIGNEILDEMEHTY